MADFLEGKPWLSVSFYGDYKENNYVAQLISANGIEQKKEIKLSNNGSANFNLNIFRDTIQAVPLPVKIRVANIENEESYFDVVLIDEVVKFKYRPQYLRKARCIAFMDEDINQNATLEKYGDSFKLEMDYSESEVNEKGVRRFPIPEDIILSSGYYRIVRERNVNDLFAIDEEFEVSLQKDQFFVSLHSSNELFNSFSDWIEQFIYDLIMFRRINKLENMKMTDSYRRRYSIINYANDVLSDNDIANIALLGNILEGKIPNAHKAIIAEVMVKISESILSNEDRYRIVKRLVETNASNIVFNVCKKNYSLLLLELPKDETIIRIKELAAAMKPISIMVSLQILLKGNVPITETFGSVAYRDAIGQDAFVELMTTDVSEEEQTADRRHFLREDGMSRVHIAVNSDITGINNLFEMIDEKKSRTGRIYLDKKKIPDIGTYFAGTRYVDLFVNWYIRNHMGDIDNDPDLRNRMKQVFEPFKANVWNKPFVVNKNESVAFFLNEYNSVLMERTVNKGDVSEYRVSQFTFSTYFYFEGIAALIAQLNEFNKFPEVKKEANSFIIRSFQVAPLMAERDVMMAMVYVYLRRKEN